MATYRSTRTVEARQITDATFDAPHPNPEHFTGVIYDSVNRCARVRRPSGVTEIARLGDWLTQIEDVPGFGIVDDEFFKREFERVP